MQRHPELKGIGARTLRALWRSARRIDAAFRRDPVNRNRFIGMFRHGSGLTHALRRMNRYDVLGRYLPTSAASSARCSTTSTTSTPWTSTS